MGKHHKYMFTTQFSFGEVKSEIKPASGYEDQCQALDAMLVTAQTSLTAWVIDNTIDPEPKDGKQEQIAVSIKDGQKKIADLMVSVPTTANFSKIMFEGFLQQSIVPSVQKTYKSYPSTRPGQQPESVIQGQLSQNILPSALQETSRIKPQQLQTR